MKRKLLVLTLTLLLFGVLSFTASADILWEPIGGDIYYDYENCETVARTYVVPEGMTVNLYTSPKNGSLIKTLEAGTRVYVGFRQDVDGVAWGVGYPYGDYRNEGWFRLGRLQLEYDHEQFMEDHTVSYEEGALTECEIQDQIRTWTYPGSGVQDGAITTINSNYNDGKLEYRYVYTDPDGGRWGYVGYYMGRCGWIYLDDLENPDPPRFPQQAKNTVTDTSPTEDTPGGSSLLLVVVLVAAVVIVTGVLIVALKKRRPQGAS